MSWKLAFVRVFNGNPDANGVFKGTAFFIRPQQLLTVRHVLESCPNGVFLRVPDGGVLAVESQWVEAFERDVATIHLPREFPITPLLLARNPPNLRDAVTLCGFYDKQQSLHERQTHISGYVNVQHTWNIADGVTAGMSGGAVIREGELVGLIQARDEESKNITYCIPIDVIHSYIGRDSNHNSNIPTAKYKTLIYQLNSEFNGLELEVRTNCQKRIMDAWLKEVGIL